MHIPGVPRLSTSACPRSLRPSPTGAANWFSPGRIPVMRPYISTPTTPPVISHRRTQLVHLPGGEPATPPTFARLRCLRRSHIRTPSWYISREGPKPQFPSSARPRRLRPSPTGTPIGSLPGGAPVTPTYIGNAHTASGRLLPAHPVRESPKRGLCHTFLHRHALRTSPIGAPS